MAEWEGEAPAEPHTLIDKSGKVVNTWRGWGGDAEELEIRKEPAKLLEDY